MRLTSPVFLLLLLLLAVSCPGRARGQASADAKQLPKIELIALSEAGVIRDLHFQTVEGVRKLDIYSRGFAPPVTYQGSSTLVFFRPVAEDLGLDENRQVVGQVDLPAGSSRVMLLFKTDPDREEESYRIFAFDNDLGRFPAGAYRFFNTAPQPIICWLGENRFELPPDGFRIASAVGDENDNVTLRIYRQEEGELVRIYSSVWQVKDTRRTTVFLTPSASRVQNVSVRKFVEPIVEERDEATAAE